MPLKDFIAQLQSLEDANPGIDCVLNDCVRGINQPVVEIVPAHFDEYGNLDYTQTATLNSTRNLVEKYSTTSPQAMWDSFGDNKGRHTCFEEYRQQHENILNDNKKRLDLMEKGQPMVVIRI